MSYDELCDFIDERVSKPGRKKSPERSRGDDKAEVEARVVVEVEAIAALPPHAVWSAPSFSADTAPSSTALLFTARTCIIACGTIVTPCGTTPSAAAVSSSGVDALSVSSTGGLPTSGSPAGSRNSNEEGLNVGCVLLAATSVLSCTAAAPGSESCRAVTVKC